MSPADPDPLCERVDAIAERIRRRRFEAVTQFDWTESPAPEEPSPPEEPVLS